MADARLDNISKNFGSIQAICDLSLNVQDGEFLVLLGPTGVGKTTLLRLIAGLETPDSGQVWIDQVEVTHSPPVTRDIAFIFQQYSLYPHYNVYDNLCFPLRSPVRRWKESKIRQRVHQIAELLHIEKKLQNRVTELSGGEMQRVSIGRALVREPKLFLMDEPLSSLDAKLREDLRIELKHIQGKAGSTIVYVTHDQTEAMTLADRIGILDQGRLLQLEPPSKIYQEPVNIYAAKRLGSPQINLFPPEAFAFSACPEGTQQLGVRPEDVSIGVQAGSAGKVIETKHLGDETVITIEIESTQEDKIQIQALESGLSNVRQNSEVKVGFDPKTVMFFDTGGQRLKAL